MHYPHTAVSSLSTAPFDIAMPRGQAEFTYHPNHANALPRAPVAYFARESVAVRPSASAGFWRVAKTVTRSSYLPAPDVPGPGQYTPRTHKNGGHHDMCDKAASRQSRPKPQSPAPGSPEAAWPQLQQQRRTIEYRVRTLGDGSRMLLPSPGITSAEPVTFVGRETALLKKQRDLLTSRMYAETTAGMMWNERGGTSYSAENGPPSRAGRPLRWPQSAAVA